MRRILIHIPMQTQGEYDIFSSFDRKATIRAVQEVGGNCPNFGNRLWFQGLISAIQCQENQIEFFSSEMTKDQINRDYDLVIAPMANVFAEGYAELLNRLADRFEDIRIPVFVIACGVQANNFDELDSLVSAIKEPATRFISNVYKTGGEFALRGYFTKEFFDKLGFSSAVVTGCPSVFQLGRDYSVSDEKVPEELFKPLLNGAAEDYIDLYDKYDNAVFFDQNVYFHELFEPMNGGMKDVRALIKRYGPEMTKVLLQDRIRMFPHMNLWREHLIQEKFNFSYGSRIHGSVMPILAGIPAVLEYRDARTREIAEFFDIPMVRAEERHQYASLYELYREVSYQKFNENFAARFDVYEKFLIQCGIVDRVNQTNPFFCAVDPISDITGTKELRAQLYREYEKHRFFCNAYAMAVAMKRKIGL